MRHDSRGKVVVANQSTSEVGDDRITIDEVVGVEAFGVFAEVNDPKLSLTLSVLGGREECVDDLRRRLPGAQAFSLFRGGRVAGEIETNPAAKFVVRRLGRAPFSGREEARPNRNVDHVVARRGRIGTV